MRILTSFFNEQTYTNPYTIFITGRGVKTVKSANFPHVTPVIIVDGDTLNKTLCNIVVIEIKCLSARIIWLCVYTN